ncbi:hypothetical protein [Pengzhenrongella sp.]|uniref:hypothetical protein n=1 Tax=Pengzhenrongella sp. TaxID=2888820 RepID=UPI002F92314B
MTLLGEQRSVRAGGTPHPRLPLAANRRDLTARGRHFADLADLIVSKERELRRRTWEIPEPDAQLRLRAAQDEARRRAQFAESARLAGLRRKRREDLGPRATGPGVEATARATASPGRGIPVQAQCAGGQNRIVHPSRRAWSSV